MKTVFIKQIIFWVGLFVLGSVISLKALAGGTCDLCMATTVDAVLGDPQYADTFTEEIPTTTKAFNVPDGYKMVEVEHPDEITCTARPVPNTWSIVPIAPVIKYRPARVTAGEEAELKAYQEAQ